LTVRTEVKNHVTMIGNAVAAEVSLDDGPHRTWLWLGPVHGGVEVRRVEQARGVDPEESPDSEHDPQVVARESFPNLDVALEELASRGVDTDVFDAIWKTSNPF